MLQVRNDFRISDSAGSALQRQARNVSRLVGSNWENSVSQLSMNCFPFQLARLRNQETLVFRLQERSEKRTGIQLGEFIEVNVGSRSHYLPQIVPCLCGVPPSLSESVAWLLDQLGFSYRSYEVAGRAEIVVRHYVMELPVFPWYVESDVFLVELRIQFRRLIHRQHLLF